MLGKLCGHADVSCRRSLIWVATNGYDHSEAEYPNPVLFIKGVKGCGGYALLLLSALLIGRLQE